MASQPKLLVQCGDAAERLRLEALHGKGNVWNAEEVRERFEILLFMGPYCAVRDKVTGKLGTVEFQPSPRLFFGYRED